MMLTTKYKDSNEGLPAKNHHKFIKINRTTAINSTKVINHLQQ